MSKKIGIFVGGILLAFMIVACVLIANSSNGANFSFAMMADRVMAKDFTGYDVDTIIPASNDSGGLPEKIEGDQNAPVILYEYADYSCSHCAELNLIINKIVEDYNGKVAVVFRNYLISYFKNNVITASAATAASIQGYWQPYKDLLFENQSTWYSMSGTELRDYLKDLFKQASDGQGNVSKFYQDMNSEKVAERVAFEFGLGAQIEDLSGTPHFRINGKQVSASDLRTTIDELLK